MPTVPRFDSLQVAANGLPMARMDAPQFQDYASRQTQQAGEGMQRAGSAISALAIDAQNEANVTVAKDIDAQLTADVNNLLYHPETGFMGKQGKDVLEGYDQTAASLTELRKKTIDGIKNPQVKKIVDHTTNFRLENAFKSMDIHSGGEIRKYKIQVSDSRAKVVIHDAVLSYSDDERFYGAIHVAQDEARQQGKMQGWDDTTVRMLEQSYTNLGHRMRYEAWALKDPLSAFQNYMQNAERMDPLVRDDVGRKLFQHAAPAIAEQINILGGSGVVSQQPGSAREPRGVRNNNPGNIIRGGTQWESEVPGGDPRYASFSTPEAGIRAMGKTLINYQDKYGLNTIEGIVSRWAPASENDTASYVSTVAKEVGQQANAPLDLHDMDTLGKLTRAMIRVENGKQPYSDQQIATGLAAAVGKGLLPKAGPTPVDGQARTTGFPLLDQMPSDWRQHVLTLAHSQGKQQQAEYRNSLSAQVADATAEFMATGYSSNSPNESEFIRAYGQADGLRLHRDFQTVATLGQTLQHIKTLPASNLADLLQTAKPAPGEGFAARQHNYEILHRAVGQVQQARVEDPVGYALSIKSYGIQPIQRLDDPRALAGELSRRAAAAPQMAADYGTAPQLLTKGEAKALSATIKASPVEAQKAQLATIYAGVKDMGLFKSVMQTIAPDNPTAAVAGIYQARGFKTNQSQDVADLILRGQAILTPNTKTDGSGHAGGQSLIKMPEEKLMLSDWNSVTGDAFKGKEQASDLFMQTSKAIYAARSAEEGDYSGVINSKRWKSSIMLATGGIEKHNGAEVVLPYGYGYDRFQNELKEQAERIVKDGGAFNTSPGEMMRLPVENVGDGRYLFRRGAGYLVNKDGRPVVVDLSGGR